MCMHTHASPRKYMLLHTSMLATATYLPEMCGKYSSHTGHIFLSQL